MKNLRYVNDQQGIYAEYASGDGGVYLDPGSDVHARAIAGDFGPIAPCVAPPEPSPDPVVPHQVTRRQGRLALHQAGKLQAVEAAIGDDIEAQIEYEADTWERDNAFLQSMWAQLGGTESELDDLFILASGK